MDFIRKNPFLFLLLSLAAGIGFGSLPVPAMVTCFFFAFSFFLFVAYWLIRRFFPFFNASFVFLTAVFLFLSAVGMFRISEADRQARGTFTGKQALFEALVLDDVVEKPKTYMCQLQLRHSWLSDSVSSMEEGRAIVYIAKDSLSASLQSGDIILFSAFFPPYSPDPNLECFDYPAYLLRQGIASTVYIPVHKWKRVGHEERFSLKRYAVQCRDHLLEVYRKYGIEGENFAVLSALTLGDRSELEPHTKRAFSVSGAMHILAVSGLHVGIVYAVFYYLFFFLGKARGMALLKSLVIVLLLWVYAFITGLSPSVLRATLMFSLVAMANCFSRKSSIYNTVSISAFFLLLVQPHLLFNVGFQLSYSAVLSIVLLQAPIYKWIYFKYRILRWLWGLMSVSIAAQVGTFVWCMFYFHQFSTYFLLTNLIVVPAASVIIYTAVLLFLVSPFTLLGKGVGILLNMELDVLNAVVHGIESLPFAQAQVFISFPQMLALFAALALLLVYLFSKRHHFSWLAASFLCLAFVFSLSLLRKYQSSQTDRLLVYSAGKVPVIQLSSGLHSQVFTTDTILANRYVAAYSLKHRFSSLSYECINDSSFYGFLFDNERCVLLNNEVLYRKQHEQALVIDHLFIGNIGRTRPDDIFQFFRPKNIVLLPALSNWKRSELKKLSQQYSIPCFDMKEQGIYATEVSHVN